MTFVYGAATPSVVLGFYHASYFGALFAVPAEMASYLILAEVKPQFRRWFNTGSFITAGFLLVQFFLGGFYYSAFRPGVWGNLGVLGPPVFWPVVTPFVYVVLEFVAFLALLRARTKTKSHRHRRQVTLAALSFPATFLLFFPAWYLEDTYGLPPLELFTGVFSLGILATLMVGFRYLRGDDDVLQAQLPEAILEAVFILDKNRRIVGTSPAVRSFLPNREHLRGRDFAELVDNPSELSVIWESLRKQKSPSEVTTSQIAGIPFGWSLSPQRDRFGDFIGAVVLVAGKGTEDPAGRPEGFTLRELEVAELLNQGASNKEIAKKLFVSVGTVKSHVHSILQKTGCQSRDELVLQKWGKPE
jgi:DNA-binding CsgD family transcriptional regulator